MKNKFTYLIVILSISFFLSSCKKDGYSVTESGLRYHFYEKKNLDQPNLGEVLQMHLIYRNAKDSILYDSRILGDSFLIELTKPSSIGGLEEGFAMMGKGDSASFLVNADSVFDKLFHQPLPSYINKGEVLRFDVKLNGIMSRDEMNAFLKQKGGPSGEIEAESIHEHLVSNNLNVQPVKEGVYNIRFVEGKGILPKIGDEVTVMYIARSLSGIVYDASDSKGAPLKFILGEGDYLPAFVDAIMTMKKGGVSRIVLSSANAYGAQGYGPVPANAPLVFELELIHVKPKVNS